MHFDKYRNPPKSTRPWTLYRIAIWHKNKIVSAISMVVWIANIGIVINGKYLSHILGGIHCKHTDIIISRYCRGEFLILTVLNPLGSPDSSSFALAGRRKRTPASRCSMSGPIDFLVFLYSLRTLCYSSSCSLACFACDSKQAMPSVLAASSGIRCGGGSALRPRFSQIH